MNVPDELRYSSDHEWVRVEDGKVRIGITDYAQDALGDVVFVQVPEVGHAADAGSTVGEVESTKSVSEIYAPLAGTVLEINPDLEAAGWIAVVDLADPAALESLMDAAAYRELTEG
jgi:glycine cleavage system H protein